jgi:hypothetical protein
MGPNPLFKGDRGACLIQDTDGSLYHPPSPNRETILDRTEIADEAVPAAANRE